MRAGVELQVLGERLDALLDAVADDEEQDAAGAQAPVDRVVELVLFKIGRRSDEAPDVGGWLL